MATETYSFTLEREFDAPIETVWRAWTDADVRLLWAAPEGYTATEATAESRVGGHWRSVFRKGTGGDGDFACSGEYTVFEPPRRFVSTHRFEWPGGPETLMTLTLEPRGAGTFMRFEHTGFTDTALKDSVRLGTSEELEHLATYLADVTRAGTLELVLERHFPHSPELVWAMFTEPEHIRHTLIPKDFVTVDLEAEFRPGGRFRHTMRGPEGDDHTCFGEYVTIDAPERLMLTHAWEAYDRGTGPVTTVTITLTPNAGGTRLTLCQTGFADPVVRDLHVEGWSEAFDNLRDHAAKVATL